MKKLTQIKKIRPMFGILCMVVSIVYAQNRTVEPETVYTYSASGLSTNLTCGILKLTSDNSDECVQLSWNWLDPAPTGNYSYTLYQWDEILNDWQTTSTKYDKTIKVLNVYPIDGSDQLYEWVNDPAIGLGKIDVYAMLLSDFNASPALSLNHGSSSYYYDVVMFGSWDYNGTIDLSNNAVDAIKDFLNSGHGVLFGHDTQYDGLPNFASLSNYTNLDIRTTNPPGNRGSKNIKAIRDGYLLKYPHHISFDAILTIPYTHSTRQYANGIVWMNFPDPLVDPRPGEDNPEQINEVGGTNNFYLTTWNNAAMIQTGHSNGNATDDEKKVLANTLWYLAQFTTNTTASVCSALDLAKPETPTLIQPNNCSKEIEILSYDKASAYKFYVKATNINSIDTCFSNELEVIRKSGLSGFYVFESTISDASDMHLQDSVHIWIAAIDNQIVTYTVSDAAKAVHVQAVDSEGNLSLVKTIQITLYEHPNPPKLKQGADTTICDGKIIDIVFLENLITYDADLTPEFYTDSACTETFIHIVADYADTTSHTVYVIARNNTTGCVTASKNALALTIAIEKCSVFLNMKVFLQGVTQSGSVMSNHIQDPDYFPATLADFKLPTTDPYDVSRATYAQINNPSGPVGKVVDWILVEIWGNFEESGLLVTYYDLLESQVLLLKTDGTIVDTNNQKAQFLPYLPGNVRIVIKHRNHLSIMTHEMSFDSDIDYDFSTGIDKAFKSPYSLYDPMVMKDGVACLWAGDLNMDGLMDNLDITNYDIAWRSNIKGSYIFQDVNMDGFVDNLDGSFILKNAKYNYFSPARLFIKR